MSKKSSMFSAPTVTTVCERLEAGIAMSLPKSVTVRVVEDPMKDFYIISMKRKLLAHIFGERYIKYPENWKEAFKERWFPGWLKKRFPVKYKEYNALIVFPDYFDKHPASDAFKDQKYYFAFGEFKEDK